MTTEDRIWQLVSLQLSDEATAGELEELSQLLRANPDTKVQVSRMEQVWAAKGAENMPAIETAFDKHLQRLSNHLAAPAMQYENPGNELETKAKKPFFRRSVFRMAGVAVAASLVIAILVYRFYNTGNTKPAVAANIVTTKPGSKTKINLPDGTQVWLNADSRVTYDDDYGKTKREIKLAGEAYFDVVRDKNRPFIIHTSSVQVKVLGTAFNVRSYPNEATSETSLIRGAVEVTLNSSPDKKIILKPNEKLVVQNKDVTGTDKEKRKTMAVTGQPLLTLSQLHYRQGDSSSVETYWTKNKLAFEGETLENVARKLERWYGVTISLTDERLKAERYTSVFEDEGLPEVLHALKLTGNFNYTINKKEVIIKP